MVLCMFRIVSSSYKMALFDKYFIPHAIPVFPSNKRFGIYCINLINSGSILADKLLAFPQFLYSE